MKYDSVDYKNIKFQYLGPFKNVSFYEYVDSKELLNAIKNNQIKFSEVKNKQNEFLNKFSNIKIGKKTAEQKEMIKNLEKFIFIEKRLLIFLDTIMKCYLMQIIIQNKIKLSEKDFKY